MAGKLQAIRGMRDILPTESGKWQQMERIITDVLSQYGYHEIRMPIVEKTELFHRSIGELTDIVSKEMYTFEDRNGDSLTLRPEGTASTVRAGLEHGLFHNQTQKLWYMGPMFRHERPQQGRQRQFHQIGIEAFGLEGPDIDAEILLMSQNIIQSLGIKGVTLELNSLGTTESRAAYRQVLIEYFTIHHDSLDEDSLRRLNDNPLRILDSKNPDMQAIIEAAPVLADHLDNESREHFAQLCALLDDAAIDYRINPRLVRGLDYYGKTVFEWVTTQLGAQGTICAGGRYDGLVSQFTNKTTPAIGFAMGLERILAMMGVSGFSFTENNADIYILHSGDQAQSQALLLAEELRRLQPALAVLCHMGGGSLKSQFKKADKSGASLALILADEEIEKDQVSIKYLRQERPQESVERSQISAKILKILEQ